jgi:hypothetical protein
MSPAHLCHRSPRPAEHTRAHLHSFLCAGPTAATGGAPRRHRMATAHAVALSGLTPLPSAVPGFFIHLPQSTSLGGKAVTRMTCVWYRCPSPAGSLGQRRQRLGVPSGRHAGERNCISGPSERQPSALGPTVAAARCSLCDDDGLFRSAAVRPDAHAALSAVLGGQRVPKPISCTACSAGMPSGAKADREGLSNSGCRRLPARFLCRRTSTGGGRCVRPHPRVKSLMSARALGWSVVTPRSPA